MIYSVEAKGHSNTRLVSIFIILFDAFKGLNMLAYANDCIMTLS